jgi:hypothetical protein
MSTKNDWLLDSSEFDPNPKNTLFNNSGKKYSYILYLTNQKKVFYFHLFDLDYTAKNPIDDPLNFSTDDETDTFSSQSRKKELKLITSNSNFSLSNVFKEITPTSSSVNQLHISNANKNLSLTAETLKIFSSVNIENLEFNSKFDLLFNDLSMLKATAVQGLLGNTNFRFLAWMIFLECIPMEKTFWISSIQNNRLSYEKIKIDLTCEPRKQKNLSADPNEIDHPLSQQNTVNKK